MDGYYVVVFKDSSYRDFDGKCNYIEPYNNGRMIRFAQEDMSYSVPVLKTLSFINSDEIYSIDRYDRNIA